MFNLSEKRRFIRFEIPLTVMFREAGTNENYCQAVASNFSREGLCLVAQDFPFDAAAVIDVKMDVPDKNISLDISGEVMWRSNHDGRWEVGLRFCEVDRTGKMDVLDYAYSSWLAGIRSKAR